MLGNFFSVLNKKVEEKKITPYVRIDDIQKEFSDYVQEFLISDNDYNEYKEVVTVVKSFSSQIHTLKVDVLNLKNNLDELKLEIERIIKVLKFNELEIKNEDFNDKLNEKKINNFKNFIIKRNNI